MEYVEGKPVDVCAAGLGVQQKIVLFLKVCAAVASLSSIIVGVVLVVFIVVGRPAACQIHDAVQRVIQVIDLLLQRVNCVQQFRLCSRIVSAIASWHCIPSSRGRLRWR
jgi:hypothetical protein